LFFFCPIFLTVPFALVERAKDMKAEAFLWCMALLIGTLSVLGFYEGWNGGSATGPRFLIPSLPFWCLCLPSFSRQKWAVQCVLVALGVLSFFNMFAIASVSTLAPAGLDDPMRSVIYPAFFQGQLSWADSGLRDFSPGSSLEQGRFCFNLGERWAGLRGWASLFPLWVFQGGIFGYLILRLKKLRSAGRV
jgi:hypothetical protein